MESGPPVSRASGPNQVYPTDSEGFLCIFLAKGSLWYKSIHFLNLSFPMANCVWTYVSNDHKQFRVELYHGEDTGHVLMTVNGKISVIDFKIFESKTYTLFLDHELCEVVLDRQGDQMFYRFELNKKADTPLNRARRQRERQDLRKTVLAFVLAAAVIVGLAYLFTQLRGQVSPDRTETLLSSSGQTSVGKLTLEANGALRYSFVTRAGLVYEDRLSGTTHSNFGLPLRTGDEFPVRYASGNPNANKLILSSVSPRQFERYRPELERRLAAVLPGSNERTQRCWVEQAYRLHRGEGIAHIYHADLDPAQNPRYNRESFRRMTEEASYQRRVAACLQDSTD